MYEDVQSCTDITGWPSMTGNIIQCTIFGLDSVKFLYRSFYDAMFWICDENSVDNTEMYWLFLSSVCTMLRLFLLLRPWVGKGCTRDWERTQPGQLTSTDKRDISYHMMSRSVITSGERRSKERCSELCHLSFQVTVMLDGVPAFLGKAEHPLADGK